MRASVHGPISISDRVEWKARGESGGVRARCKVEEMIGEGTLLDSA